jgi:hypothetical protein
MEAELFTSADYAAVEAFMDIACLLFTCLSWEEATTDTGVPFLCVSQGPDCPFGEACYTVEPAPVQLSGVALDTWIVVAHHRDGRVWGGGSSPAEALGNAGRALAKRLAVASRVACGALYGEQELAEAAARMDP